MALDREQVGLLFKIDADTGEAKADIADLQEFIEGFAEGAERAMRESSTEIRRAAKQSDDSLRASFGDAAQDRLRGFLGQFGMIGETMADALPTFSAGSAALLGVGVAAVGAAAGIAKLSLSTAEYAGNISDLATKTNLTTNTIQSLRLAATLSGQSFESVSETAVIFQRRIQEAREGNDKLAASFQALGVNLAGPVDEAFRTTLEKLSRAEDGAAKTALTVELFGRSGSQLLPIMSQLGGEFENLEKRAREMGIVLDEEAIKKADEFGDQIDILKLQLGAIANDIGAFFIPAWMNYAQVIGVVTQAFRDLATGAEGSMQRLQRAVIAGLALLNPATAQFAGLLATGGKTSPGGFQGPGIDEASGLPTTILPTLLGKGGGRGGGGRGKSPETVRLPIEDFDRLTQQYFDRLNKLEEESAKRLEDARERSLRSREQTLQEIEAAEIDAIRARVERAEIAEEEGAARIAAVKVAAFARTEDQLKELLDRQTEESERARVEAEANRFDFTQGRILQAKAASLEAERQLTVDRLTELEAERRRVTEEGNRAIEDGRQRDLANQRAYVEQYQRLRQAMIEAFSERLIQQGFSPELAEAIVRQQELLGRQLTIWERIRLEARLTAQALQEVTPSFVATLIDMKNALAESLGGIVAAFVAGRLTLRQAAAEMFKAALAPLKDYLLKKARAHFAMGLAELALMNFGGAAKHFLAGAALSAAAGLIDVGASAIAGGGGAAAGGTIAPSSPSTANDRRVIEQGGPLRGGQSPQVIIIRAETEPGVIVRKVVEDYRSNGPSRQMLRRDMLGEG